MTAINAKTAQKNLCQLVSDVNDSSVPVIIVNDDGKNAVLVSEDDWNAMQETLYLYSVPGIAASIIEAGKEDLSTCTTYEPDTKE